MHAGLAQPLFGLARLGLVSSLLLVDCSHTGPLLFLRSSACPDSLLSPFNFVDLGLALPLHTMSRSGPVVPISGKQMAFLLPVSDNMDLESSLSIQSFFRLGLSLLLLDFTKSDPSAFLKSSSHSELFVFITGLTRADLCFSLPVLDKAHFGFLMLLQSMVQLEFALLVLDFLHLGFSTSARSMTCAGFALPTPGIARVDFVSTLLVIDHAQLGSLVFLQSFARPDLLTLPPDVTGLDLSILLQSLVHSAFTTSVFSCTAMGFSLFLLDMALIDLFMSLQSPARLDSSVSLFDVGCLGPPLPLQSFARCGLTPFVVGLTCADFVFLLFVLDDCSLGPPLPVQSPICSDFVVPAPDFLHSDSALFLRSLCQTELPVSAYKSALMGSPLFLLGEAHPESLFFAQSFSHLGVFTSMFESASSGFVSSMRSFVRPDFAVSLLGSSRVGLVFSMLVVDMNQLDFVLLVKSFIHMDSLMPVFDFSEVDLLLPLRSLAQMGLTSLVLLVSHIDSVFSLLVMDMLPLESLMSSHSFGQVGLLLLLFDMMKAGSMLLPQSPARLDLTLFVLGPSRFGPVFALSVVDSSSLESAPFARPFLCSGPFLFPFNFAQLEFFLLPRSCSHLDAAMLASSFTRLDAIVFLPDTSQAGLLVSSKSSGYVALVLSISDFAVPGSPLSSRGMNCCDSMAFVLGLA